METSQGQKLGAHCRHQMVGHILRVILVITVIKVNNNEMLRMGDAGDICFPGEFLDV